MPPAKTGKSWLGLLAALLSLLSGCVSLPTGRLADNLASAMLNQTDPETVRAGAPAYLLLIDSIIDEAPKDPSLLILGARLYTAFAGGLVEDVSRAKRLSSRAREYGRRALCPAAPAVCRSENLPYTEFISAIEGIPEEQFDTLYVYAVSWAGWIEAHRDDWNALADLPKVEYALQRVIDFRPDYDRGRAQLILGVMRTQLPPGLGGKPERGRQHFENAIAFSEGRDLLAKLEFARRYARLVFDQPLHDRLLGEVLEADPLVPDLTLSNVIAQQKAKELLSDGYF